VHVNPADNNLVITAGNDYTARVLDIRQLTSGGRRAGTCTAHCWQPASALAVHRPRLLHELLLSQRSVSDASTPVCCLPCPPAGNTADSKGKAVVGSASGAEPAELAVLKHDKVRGAVSGLRLSRS
jgi:hypothetical protein